MIELYDWQQVEFDRLVEHDNIFVAWEMSLGKTPFTVKWIHAKMEQYPELKTVVVVAPLNTFRSWKKTFEEEVPDLPVRYLRTDKPEYLRNFVALKNNEPGLYLIGWELMRTGALFDQYVDIIVADETHKQANPKSQQAQMMMKIPHRCAAALSGTPAANRPEGIFQSQQWLWKRTHPKLYGSYTRWLDNYWRQRRNGNVIDLVREIRPGQIIKDMPAFSRQLVRDHRDDMPPVNPTIRVDVELSVKQRRLYDRLSKNAAVWLDDDTFLLAAYPLEEDIRLRQIALGVPTMVKNPKTGLDEVTFALNCKSEKIDALVEITTTTETEAETFLVLVHSARFIPSVVHQLNAKGIKARGFSGSTPQDERDWLLDNLGKEYRVLVAGIAAIGEGTDGLQHVCHNMVWMSKHPNAYLNLQAMFRLDRPGQKHPINVWDLVALDTIDERSLERLAEIQENLDAMLDPVAGQYDL